MQLRNFTNDKLKVSLLGFGCMRFPVIDGNPSKIDEYKATEMLHYAIDHGVNYIDTAYNYHQGNSESFVGKALKNGYREKVYIATKLPVWLTDNYEAFEKYLDEQLERLETDYIDFYLLHALNENTWNKIKDLDIFKFLDEAKRKGKIKYAGFSFHDELPIFKEIVDSYPWDFCQIQLNYMDREYQAGLAGLKYAADKDISIVIMEPIKGGKLATAPKEVQAIWEQSEIKRTPARWALEWVYNFPEVSVVLSGMTTMDHVIENIATSSLSNNEGLSEDDLKLVDKVTDFYMDKTKVGCTNCGYCLPCPEGVAIPTIFTQYNNYFVYGTKEESKSGYKRLIEQGKDASKCIECGICESLCPQNLEIIEQLKEAEKVLA